MQSIFLFTISETIVIECAFAIAFKFGIVISTIVAPILSNCLKAFKNTKKEKDLIAPTYQKFNYYLPLLHVSRTRGSESLKKSQKTPILVPFNEVGISKLPICGLGCKVV